LTSALDIPESEKREALVVFALQSGNARLTEAMLVEVGLSHIKVDTIRQWAYRSRREEYTQIKGEVDGHVRAQLADGFRDTAAKGVEVAQEALRQLAIALEEGKIQYRDLGKSAQQAMVTAGIATEKGELLSGNPTSVVKTDVEDVKRELAAVGIQIVIGGKGKPEAIDVTPSTSTPAPALPAPPEPTPAGA
jgi:hypothetical protein